MAATENTSYQAIQWDFPDVLPDSILASVPAESSTSYLRSAHRQHQIALQNAQKRTKIAREKLDGAQMRLKRLRREKEGLQAKRTRMARQAVSLEQQANEIDPAMLQREMDEDAMEDLPPKDDPTRAHILLLARAEQEIQAVQSRESSLQALGKELAALKSSIVDIRHKSIVVDGALGELDKVTQTVQRWLDDPVLQSPTTMAEENADETSAADVPAGESTV